MQAGNIDATQAGIEMNKTAVKNFAVQARITLIKAVKQKAYE